MYIVFLVDIIFLLYIENIRFLLIGSWCKDCIDNNTGAWYTMLPGRPHY